MKYISLVFLTLLVSCNSSSECGNLVNDNIEQTSNTCATDVLDDNFAVTRNSCSFSLIYALRSNETFESEIDSNGDYEFDVGGTTCFGNMDDDDADGLYTFTCYTDDINDTCEMTYATIYNSPL